jgi:hypothetical protein
MKNEKKFFLFDRRARETGTFHLIKLSIDVVSKKRVVKIDASRDVAEVK